MLRKERVLIWMIKYDEVSDSITKMNVDGKLFLPTFMLFKFFL